MLHAGATAVVDTFLRGALDEAAVRDHHPVYPRGVPALVGVVGWGRGCNLKGEEAGGGGKAAAVYTDLRQTKSETNYVT